MVTEKKYIKHEGKTDMYMKRVGGAIFISCKGKVYSAAANQVYNVIRHKLKFLYIYPKINAKKEEKVE